MKKSAIVVLFVAGALGSSLALPSVASACDPAPPYWMELLESDLPECLELMEFGQPTSFHGWAPVVPFRSECEDSVEFVEVDCDECHEDQVIAPDEEFELQLASAPQGEVSEQTFAWEMGEESGTLRTSNVFTDTSDVCDGWEESLDSSEGGCAQVSVSGSGGGVLVLLAVVMMAWSVRRRR